MIGSITGIPRFIKNSTILVDVRGVGYNIHTTKEIIFGTEIDSGLPTTFFTYLSVRENALDLYGFKNIKDLEMFETLLLVSGIGPKSAMSILDMASRETLISSISGGDAGHLTKISGIGKKTAEKIVHELKDKIEKIDITKEELSRDSDVILALEALGWNGAEVRNTLKDISKDGSTNDRIREAIKILGK